MSSLFYLSDLNEDVSEEVKIDAKEGKYTVTKTPRQKSFSNELEDNVDDAHAEHVGVGMSDVHLNNALTNTTGAFRESRKIRGEAKKHDVLSRGALSQNDDYDDDVDEIPNWVPFKESTPVFVDGSDGPYTMTPPYTTHSTSTSTATTLKQSTRKRAPKRKPVHIPPSTMTNKSSADPTEATLLVDNVGAVSMEMLKTDGVTTLQDAFEEQVGSLVEKNPKSKKQSYRIKGTVCL